jgi:hypothetical protein
MAFPASALRYLCSALCCKRSAGTLWCDLHGRQWERWRCRNCSFSSGTALAGLSALFGIVSRSNRHAHLPNCASSAGVCWQAGVVRTGK